MTEKESLFDQITKANCFEDVLILSEKHLVISTSAKKLARRLDQRGQEDFTVAEFRQVYKTILELWYQNYSIAINGQPHTSWPDQIINHYIKIGQHILVIEVFSNSEDCLKFWKQAIANLVIVRQEEDTQHGKRRKKRGFWTQELSPNSLYALLSIIALIVGIALAIIAS